MTVRALQTNRRKAKVIFAAIAFFALFATTVSFAFPSGALAWDNCPRGLVNDPYPGQCRRYVDTNGDGICDLSESKPVASTTTTVATTQKVATTTTSLTATAAASGKPPTGNCPLGNCLGCRACVSIQSDINSGYLQSTGAVVAAAVSSSGTSDSGSSGGSGSSGTTGSGNSSSAAATGSNLATTTAATAAGATTTGGASFMTHYMVSPIALTFFLIYGISFFLYKTKRMRVATHRKIWNVLLLGTFLITGVFGLILTIQLDYKLPFTIPINLLFWHVEAGIVMTLISLFHMGWHFKYYRNVVRTSRRKIRAAEEDEKAGWAGRGQPAPQPAAPQPALASETREVRDARLLVERLRAAQERERRRAERETKRHPEQARGGRERDDWRDPPRPRPWFGPETE